MPFRVSITDDNGVKDATGAAQVATIIDHSNYDGAAEAAAAQEGPLLTLENLLNLKRYPANPIFEAAASGWDSNFVNYPWVVKNLSGVPYQDAEGRYYMFYSSSNSETTGHPTTPQKNDDRIGLLRSTDLVNWTRVTGLSADGSGCVLTWGNGDRGDGTGHNGGAPSAEEGFEDGTFDENDVQLGTVLYDNIAGIFKMWYQGNDNYASDNLSFGYATSADGIIWNKDSGNNPILVYGAGDDDDGLYDPHVLWDAEDDIWKMWYIGKELATGHYGTMYATSPDGIAWTRYSPDWIFQEAVITVGLVGNYVIKFSAGDYLMIYGGADQPNDGFRYATSADGIAWVPQGWIFGLGVSGEWDDKFISWPSVVEVNSSLYLYYRADDVAAAVPKIGFAALHIAEPGHDKTDFSDYKKITLTSTYGGYSYVLYSKTGGDLLINAPANESVLPITHLPPYEVDDVHNVVLIAVPTWNENVAYVASDDHHVYYSGTLYQCILDGADQNPATETTYWTAITDDDLPSKYRLSYTFKIDYDIQAEYVSQVQQANDTAKSLYRADLVDDPNFQAAYKLWTIIQGSDTDASLGQWDRVNDSIVKAKEFIDEL